MKPQRSRIPLAAEQIPIGAEWLLTPSPGYLHVVCITCKLPYFVKCGKIMVDFL